jgi:SAM-dependent methyltransferase
MHYSAYKNAEKFRTNYLPSDISNLRIIDIGSYDVNGTLRPIFDSGYYIGLDMEKGPNVDIVSKANDIPFKDSYFDVVLSSSCFEHDDFFWETFLEMCRVLKPGGFMYIQAPSNGPYHGWPGDNWRFYIDSWKSLSKWGFKNGYKIDLIESYIDTTTQDPNSKRIWDDSIGIFKMQD